MINRLIRLKIRVDAEVFSIWSSLIENCKMTGIAIKQYLVKVIKEIDGGNTDYESLLSGTIVL